MGGVSKLLLLLSTPFPRLCPRTPFFRLVRPCHFPVTSLPAALGAPCRFPSYFAHPWYGLPTNLVRLMQTQASVRVDCGEPSVSHAGHKVSFHPWPEWLEMVQHVTAGGYVDRRVPPAQGEDDDSFLVSEELSEEFRKLAGACLLCARERPDLLRSLSKRDIEVLVENGSPFLFKNGFNTIRRMKSFLGGDGSELENETFNVKSIYQARLLYVSQVLESDQACTVDVMRYLLSYAGNSTRTGDETRSGELVESSVRNLLHELVKISGGIREPNVTESTAWHNSLGYEQSPQPLRQNIEMKRGDWICHKCNFMNFARNTKCLECDEARPKRQLTGGEWECPQCDFFNYGRNMTCLRCDCKRPGEILSSKPSIGQLLNSGNVDRTEIEHRLAENDEKAERWFSKVSQLDDSSDLSSAIADEDFPEIMPLRKGTNRFVISTRKTPLERRLSNAQYRSNLGNGGSYLGKDLPGRIESDKMSEATISQTLDRILGHSSAASGTSKDAGNHSVNGEPSTSASRFTYQSRDSGYVPSSANQFHKEQRTFEGPQRANEPLHSADFNNLTASEDVTNQTAKWSNGSAQIPDVSNVQNATSDNGFPRIMPRHGEENQFNINRGDHSLTSPHYKRRIAMDQANNPNFVPFVPFPPDYFAKKDKQPKAGPSREMSATETSYSATVENGINTPQGFEENTSGYSHVGGANSIGQGNGWNSGLSRTNLDGSKVAHQTNNIWNNHTGSGAFARGVTSDGVSASGNLNPQQTVNPQKTTENWKHGFPGKSLEGSAVTEPDPLDMSEEAKAQRWFRRVAQIKDISELSKIPDEDFPEIMPMRKGVNRFVVSKRKTPLERRLTSTQYRRNLPIVSSEPGKDPTRD
ncbi:hypothetical protein Taro_028062 [Colocasia esculenta]|uniref:RanBP2-type domain-containing protein n=1 Tax=Colocasia esculenta TaxID=4460 RepID=A0A843VPB5_COLES|nr:hypothetical protein [Colocasia esculenta]